MKCAVIVTGIGVVPGTRTWGWVPGPGRAAVQLAKAADTRKPQGIPLAVALPDNTPKAESHGYTRPVIDARPWEGGLPVAGRSPWATPAVYLRTQRGASVP